MKKIFEIKNLDCAHCAAKIEEKLNNEKIVDKIIIDFINKKIIIENDKIDDEIIIKLQKSISNIEDGVIIKTEKQEKQNNYNSNFFNIILSIVFFIPALFIDNKSLSLVFYIASYIFVSHDILFKCLKNLKNKNLFDENFLMSIATIGAFCIGEYLEGIAVVLLYKIGEYFQEKAINNSKRSITDLLSLKNSVIHKKTNCNIHEHLLNSHKHCHCGHDHGHEHHNNYEDISADKIKINDIFIVKPGEMILVDGIIVKGKSEIDSSSLTGESDIVIKNTGDEVISGMINKTSVLEIKAVKNFENSTISKIIDIVENSPSKKASTEKFITRFSKIYTPVVCLLALCMFVIPVFILSLPLKIWLYRSLSFLVISCPCALVLSVPLSYFSGIGLASKNGILIKGSNFLEDVQNIDNFVFDKTGTITNGNFIVNAVKLFGKHTYDSIKDICYSLEKNSNHPIAKAIVNHFENNAELCTVKDFEEILGFGVKGKINEKEYFLGKSSYLKEDDNDSSIYLFEDGQFAAKFEISDGIKDGIYKVVKYLKNENKQVLMLTGDNKHTAKYIADMVCMKYRSDLTPIDKVQEISLLKGKTLFVGDGFNDAAVLLNADIGVSMGQIGSDAAIEASDIVFVNDKIENIIKLIKINKLTRKVVIQNIVFALLIKLLILLLVSIGLSSMWMAIFADVGVSILCVLNSTRILFSKNI